MVQCVKKNCLLRFDWHVTSNVVKIFLLHQTVPPQTNSYESYQENFASPPPPPPTPTDVIVLLLCYTFSGILLLLSSILFFYLHLFRYDYLFISSENWHDGTLYCDDLSGKTVLVSGHYVFLHFNSEPFGKKIGRFRLLFSAVPVGTCNKREPRTSK